MSRRKSQPPTKPKQKLGGPKHRIRQAKGQMVERGARTSGNNSSQENEMKAAGRLQGARMMQVKRVSSGSRRGRGAHEISEL